MSALWSKIIAAHRIFSPRNKGGEPGGFADKAERAGGLPRRGAQDKGAPKDARSGRAEDETRRAERFQERDNQN